MRRVAVGFASLLAVSFSGPAAGESELDQIQRFRAARLADQS